MQAMITNARLPSTPKALRVPDRIGNMRRSKLTKNTMVNNNTAAINTAKRKSHPVGRDAV